MNHWKLRSLIGLLILVIAAVHASPSQDPRETNEPPVFGTAVTLVTLPVFVTDKSGRAVAGLKADDFVIEDNGKSTAIVGFQALDAAAASADESRTESATLPLAVQAVMRRQFLLVLDTRFSPLAGVYFGRKSAAKYVRTSLAPDDLIAVATSGKTGMRVLTNFTSDHEYVAGVIEGSATSGPSGIDPLGLSSPGLRDGLSSYSLFSAPIGGLSGISATGSAGSAGSKGEIAEAELRSQDALMTLAEVAQGRNAASAFLEDLRELIASLAPLRGRKQIVLFSGGFSEATWKGAEGLQVLKKMEEVFREANKDDVVIHTVDLFGIPEAIDLISQVGPNGGMDSQGPSGGSSLPTSNPGRGTLIAMSLNTGGRPIQPTGDFGVAFGEVDRVSRHSYVLAFEASDTGEKSHRSRRLKVRVRRPGLSVSHRTEYVPASPTPSRGGNRLLATEAIAKGLTGGPLRLHLATLPYRDDSGKLSVHAVLRIEGGLLADTAAGTDAKVQIYGYAMDGGRVLDGLALETSVDLSRMSPEIRESGINVITAFPAGPGSMDLRFFVRSGTDLTGSVQQNVTMPDFAAGERALSAPFFLFPSEGHVVIPFQPTGRPPIRIPFYAGNAPLIPDVLPSLVPGRQRELLVFAWRGQSGVGPFNVTAELARRGEAAIPVRLEGDPHVSHEADGFDRYIVKVLPPDVPPGAYRLRLTFRDPATGRSSVSETSIDIAK